MKKKDLLSIAINVTVLVALTIIYVFTDISLYKSAFIIENLIFLSLFSLYLLCSKVVYGRIKSNKNYKNNLVRLSIIYTLSLILYSFSNLLNNVVIIFILNALYLTLFFMYFVTFTASIYKMVIDKDNKNIKKLVIILSVVIIVMYILINIFKAYFASALVVVNPLLTLCGLSAFISLVIVCIICILIKLILIK